LLGVIQFAGAAGVLPKHVVYIFEGLFKHGRLKCVRENWQRQF
jgi:hypothetical protein